VDWLPAVEVKERLRTGGRDAHLEAVEQHSVHGRDFGPLQLPPSSKQRSTGGEAAAPSPVRAVNERGRAGVGAAYAEPHWPAADVIVGNPPFLGGGKIRSELGDAYTDALFKLYGDRIPNFSDLCCYWFEKARAMVADGKVKRVGLLATQGIRGGANREVLRRVKETGDIFWAQSDRNWIQDGVAVHLSMIGFDNGAQKSRVLDDEIVSKINADLTASVDLTLARPLHENFNIAFQGPSPKAPFDIDASLARQMLLAPPNLNGRPNSDVIRAVISAIDIGQKPRGMWTIDFGLMSQEEAAFYEQPFEYVKKNVLPIRKTRRDDYRGQWWQYARPRPEMREALKGKTRYIATQRVSKYRIFIWLQSEVLANDGTIVFAFDDDYSFGVLQSRIHELWARGTGTQLREEESGFRYTPTSTFETFPFPWPPGQEPSRGKAFAQDRQSIGRAAMPDNSINTSSLANASPLQREHAIAQAAKELNDLRDNWLNPYKDQPAGLDVTLKKRTLTNLYNENPTWLQNAHRKLDEAVFAAYGWPSDLGDDEILARLLELNLKRAGQS
jgi:type II restriction/modification system DNA methylase subunit YeeA